MSAPITLGFITACKYLQVFSQDGKFPALTCKSALQSCLRIHLDCLTVLLRAIYLVLKTASRDAVEVIKVSSYIFWDSISSNNVIVWETLLFPLLALVGDQAPRKDDGTDFGCV